MEAPPYSPAATSSERTLLDGYSPLDRREEDEDPFEALSRRQGKSAMSSGASLRPSHNRHASQPSTSSPMWRDRTIQRRATAPTNPFVYPYPDPWALDLSYACMNWRVASAPTSIFSSPYPGLYEPSQEHSPELLPEHPPGYAPLDELARSFRLEPPFIYTMRTSSLPRYQLMQEFTRSGRPKSLSIRRLLPTESRSRSIATANPSSGPTIRYDEDATMYSVACYELQGLAFKKYEMQGHRSSTLDGKINVESGKSLFGRKWSKVWQVTKNARRDSLNPENDARMQRYGYHADDELDKRLLFSIRKGIWVNEEGVEVAREIGKGAFEVYEALGKESWHRDLAVSCWIMRLWMGEGIRWENDVKGW